MIRKENVRRDMTFQACSSAHKPTANTRVSVRGHIVETSQ